MPCRKLPSGMTSLSSPPNAVQSRRASSSSLSDCDSQSAFFRPRRRLSRMMAATCLPFPQPVPSPSIQPRRKRTGSDRVSPSWVDEGRIDLGPLIVAVLELAAVDGFPLGADAVFGREMPGMGLARQDDALELGVRQQAIGDDALRQHRAGKPAPDAARRPWRRTGPAASDARPRPAPARRPAATARRVRCRWQGRRHRRRVPQAPVSTASSETGPQSWDRRVSGVDTGFGPRRVAGFGATGLPNRSRAGPAGTGAGAIGWRCGTCAMTASSSPAASAARAVPSSSTAGSVAALQHGEAGVEPGAAPCIGAAVDRHGEDAARRGIETADGIAQARNGPR